MPLSIFESETPLTLAAAARHVPSRTGRTANAATLWRWARTGARSAAGARIMLETARCGGTTFTSKEALGRFLEALNISNSNGHSKPATKPATIATSARRKRERA